VLADQHIIAFGRREAVMTVDHPFVTGFFGADRRKLL
jgi:phospholipid/cholesterol/gamma-HCH transport system ATP-binding protein